MATFQSFVRTVTTAGTEVRMSTTDLFVKKIIVRGLAANTGHIYIGNDGADAVASTSGLHLKVGDQPIVIGDIEITGRDDYFNLKNMWVDSSVNGEGISVLYFQ